MEATWPVLTIESENDVHLPVVCTSPIESDMAQHMGI